MKEFKKYTAVLGMNCFVRVLVDDEDAWILEQKPWDFAYNKNKIIYVSVMVDPARRIRRTLHNMVLLDKRLRGKCVKHINGDTTDNRKSNLKIIDLSLSQTRRANRTDSDSGYRGVYYRAESKIHPWIAVVKCEGKREYLGSYATKEEAAQIVDDFRREIYGDNIPLNFKK